MLARRIASVYNIGAMTNAATYSEQVDLSQAPSANFNRASAGYSVDVLLSMVASVGAGFYCYPGSKSSSTQIGHRDNHLPSHGALIEAAARRLKSYGLRVRRSRCRTFVTVYGPERGGSQGRYSR